jgi:hypothetical protein
MALCFCFSAHSQSRSDTSIYVPLPGGGDAVSRSFFLENLKMEVGARSYAVVEREEGADYVLSGSLSQEELSDDESSSLPMINKLHLVLVDKSDGHIVAEQDLYYEVLEETYEILPLLVFNMIANIPLTKLTGSALVQQEALITPEEEKDDVLDRRLYLGLMGGGSYGVYLDARLDNYVSAEVPFGYQFSLFAAYKFLSFLSLQAGASVYFDSAEFRASAINNGTLTYRTDTYQSWTLQVPVTAKFTFPLDPFILSLFVGPYFTVPLGPMTRKTAGSAIQLTTDYTLSLPIGVTGGVEVGGRLGPGILFADLRYGADIGRTHINDSGLEFHRSRISLSLGYQLGFFKKKYK